VLVPPSPLWRARYLVAAIVDSRIDGQKKGRIAAMLYKLAAALVALSTCAASALPDQDADLNCATAALLGMTRAPKRSEPWYESAISYTFYLGRLTTHDARINWGIAVMQNAREMSAKSTTEELNSACQELVDLYVKPLEGEKH
jgi:hypothetical protein